MNHKNNLFGVSSFLEEANKYTEEVFQDIDIKELLDSAIKGEVDNSKLINIVLNLLGKEVISAIKTIAIVLVIIIIHSILKSITDELENKGISQIIFYVEYILIVTLIMTGFAEIVKMTVQSISNLTSITNLLIPILITLMITTGSIASAGLIQPILLVMTSFIGNIINMLIVPVIMVSTVLSIVSNISDRVQIGRLSKFFKSSIVWALGIILTIFVGVLSLEGTLSSSVDGITVKTVKAATGTVIPVVGKILGDSVDTVLGCAGILKNAVGLVGVIIILGICIVPIIKLAVLTRHI